MTSHLQRPLAAIYEFIAGRPSLAPLNMLLYRLALKGLGVWNGINGERNFLRRHLSTTIGPLVFDIGANEGLYSRMVLQVNPTARVHAFEPHPVTFRKLAANAERFGFTAHNFALGEEVSSATIYDYVTHDGSEHASLHEDVITKIHRRDALAHPVNVVTLDGVCRELGIHHIDLLKIDVEGHECSVLKGGMHSLTMGIIDTIQFEFNEMNVITRTFMQDFYDALPNYSFHRLLPRGSINLDNCRPFQREIFGAQNIVAVRNRPLVNSKNIGYIL